MFISKGVIRSLRSLPSFLRKLATRGEGLPLLYDKIPPAKSLLKKSNACYTNIVFS